MEVYDNNFVVSRNETFVYDRIIQNKDGSPFILSSQFQHPLLRFTIADETYVVEDRYILNRYLEFQTIVSNQYVNMPRFYMTNPVPLYDNNDDIATSFSESYVPGNAHNPIPTISGVTIYNFAVYYIVDNTGTTKYAYYKNTTEQTHWTEYSYRMTIPFNTEITSFWTAKNYVYSIHLMDGTTVRERMITEATREGVTNPSLLTDEELYDIIATHQGQEVPILDGKEIIIDTSDEKYSPYFTIDFDYPMLNHGNITVKNDQIGGLYK